MIATSYPSVSDYSEKILCFHANTTSKLQIARIANIPGCRFERVVFPGQRLLFEAQPNAELEIYNNVPDGIVLSERILCDRIQVNEENGVLELDNPAGLVSRIA